MRRPVIAISTIAIAISLFASAASAQLTKRYSAFFHAMLDAGVYLPPSAYEGWFVSTAHDDGAMHRIVEALPGAAAAAAQVRG